MRTTAWRRVVCGMMVPLLAAAVVQSETLGPDGFPLEWTAEDFSLEVGQGVSPSPVRRAGMVSVPVSALPRVAPDPSTTPVLTSASVQVSLTRVGAVLPVVQVEDVGKAPLALDELDRWGPLTSMAGGMKEDQWRGVSASQIVQAVEQLAARPVGSQVLSDVVARSLLTRGGGEGSVVPAGRLLAARAQALQGMGLDEQAFAVWRVVPAAAHSADSVLARGWAASSLMAGESAEPCALARALVVGEVQGFWREATAACSVLDRMSGDVGMALDLVNEQGGTFDPVLRAVLVALRDGEAPVALPAGPVSPLVGAVLAQYPALVRVRDVPRLPAVVLRRVMQTAVLPLPLRAEAAEALAVRAPTAVAAEAVRVLYEAFPFPPDQVQKAPVLATTMAGAEARALLWQAVRVSADADRVAAWNMLAASLARDGRGAVASWMVGKAGLVPSAAAVAALSEGWVQAVRGAWQGGDSKQALAWRVAAQDVASPTAVLIGQRAQMGLEAALVGSRLEEGVFEQWLVARSLADEAQRMAAVRALAVLEGVGVALPDGAWARLEMMLALRDDRAGGDMVRVEALRALAAAKRTGPVVLRLAGWAQQRPLAGWAPLEAKTAVAALREVGLTGEAVALAREILAAPAAPVVSAVAVVSTTAGVQLQPMPAARHKAPAGLLPPPEVAP